MENVHYIDRLEFYEYDLPENTKGALERYILRGIPTGGFLDAVLSNDLRGSFARADIENREALYQIVMWLHNYAPSGCHGSKERVTDWLKQKQREREIAQGIELVNEDHF